MKVPKINVHFINQQQRGIINTLLLLFIFLFVIFSSINIARGVYTIAFIEIFCILFSLILYFYTKKLTNYKQIIFLISLFFAVIYSLLLFIVFNLEVSSTALMWIFIIPSSSYAVMGKKLGFIFSLIFGSAAVFFYYTSKVANIEQTVATANIVGYLLLTWYISHVYETSHAKSMEKIATSSLLDSLTGLYNRKVLTTIYQYHNKDSQITNIIIDIDFFKKINDNYGHDAGDTVLVCFSKELIKHFDNDGYVVRMGGEEFCIILPKIPIHEALQLCQKCLHDINHQQFEYDNQYIKVTFSAGISTYPQDGDSYSDLLRVADQRLYQAKESGRNKIVSV